MTIENLSLRDLTNLGQFLPDLANFASRQLANTYEDFIKVIYKDIDRIVEIIQENPELRQNDIEDRLSIEIVSMLRFCGYNATHDQKFGGHTDILVRKNNYVWIAEAKIHRDYEYLWQGFQQLNTRYSTGDSNQKDGGILIYIRGANTKNVIDEWKKRLSNKNLQNYNSFPCPKRELAFYSTHTHEGSGLQFTVRHIPVILYFSPQDKK